LIADEANAIGPAYLRLDLLPSERTVAAARVVSSLCRCPGLGVQPRLDDSATQATLGESAELQAAIWTMATSDVQRDGVPTSTMMLVIGALNEMIDITATRRWRREAIRRQSCFCCSWP
jgi:hypothetical protein